MRIAAIDDDPAFLKRLVELAKQSQVDPSLTLVPFSSFCAFSAADETSFDAFFLDIYLGNENGLLWAEHLRKSLSNPLVVFITSSEEDAVKAFDLEAVHYLVKPVSLAKFDEAISRLLTLLASRGKRFFLERKDGRECILFSEVVYIESFGNEKEIVLTSRHLSARLSFAETLSLLAGDKRFYPLSRSTIVNFDYVKAFQKEGLLLKTGVILPVPRDKRKDVNAAFIAYFTS